MKKVLLALFSLTAMHSALAQDLDAPSAHYNFKGNSFKLDSLIGQDENFDKADTEVIDTSLFPKVVDLIPLQSAIKNQGDRGSCAFFTSNALMESLIKQRQKIEVNLSEEFLVWKVKGDLGYNPTVDGSIASQNMEGFTKGGIVLERDLPFQPSWFTPGLPCGKYKGGTAPTFCYSHNKPDAQVMSKMVSSAGFVPEVVSTSSAKAVQLLATKKAPLIIGLLVNPNGWDAKTGYCQHNDELQRECDSTPGLCGGHSVMVVGYDLNKRTFTFKNSWSTDWGNKGYGTISFDYLDNYGRGEMVTGRLTQDIAIPADYAVSPEKTSVVSNSSVELKDITGGKTISTKLNASIKNMDNSVYYVSAYLMTTKDNEAITNENAVPVNLSAEYQKEFGKYAKATSYKVFKREGATGTVSLTDLNIKEAMIDKTQLSGGKDAYIRLSTYVYGDNGFVQLSREYKKLEFGL